MFYPIFLDVRGRDCLVVGAGVIGTGKVNGLLEAGARVRVIAPQASAEIARLSARGDLVWHPRPFAPDDIGDAFVVIAATDDKALNARVYQLANAQQRVANAVDDMENCNFIAPAVTRAGAVQIAVSTSGRSPALAKQLRDRIERDVLTPETAALAEFLGSWRPLVKHALPSYQRRMRFWEAVLDSRIPELLERHEDGLANQAMGELLAQTTFKVDGARAINGEVG